MKMLKIISVASAVITLSITPNVHADVSISPGETYINNVDYTISTGFFDNAGELINQSRIENQAYLYNSNMFINEVSAIFDNYGEYHNLQSWSSASLPDLINNGTVNNYSNGPVGFDISAGSFTNNNAFNNYGFTRVSSSSQVINIGNINNNAAFTVSDSSQISNQGTITNDGVFTIDSSSSVNNSGNFINNNELALRNNGAINNQGYIENNSLIHIEYGDSTGSINNSNVFQNNKSIINVSQIINSGIFYNGTEGLSAPDRIIEMSNGGKILNLNTFNNIADGMLRLREDSHFTNGQSAVLNNGAKALSGRASIELFDSVLTNHGTVNNNSNIYAGPRYITYGNDHTSIHNASTGTFNNGSGDYSGDYPIITSHGSIYIDNSNMLNEGTFNNIESSITFTGYAQLTNSGVFNNTENSRIELDSIYSPGTPESFPTINNSGTINNNGTITETNNRTGLNNSGTIVNSVGAEIAIAEITSSGDVINNGLIDAYSIKINNGVLSGNGQINTTSQTYYPGAGLIITENGTLAPGDTIGQMQINGDLDLNGTFQFQFGINPDRYAQNYDLLNVDGNVELGPNSVLDISFLDDMNLYLYDWEYDFLFADNISGDFSSLIFGDVYNQYGTLLAFDVNLIEGDGGFVQDHLRLTISENYASPVPVPAAAWLFGSGLLALVSLASKKREQ